MGEIVNFTFGADYRQFKQELEAMRKNCQIFIDTVGNGFAALGLDSVLDLFGKLSAAGSKLGSMFSSCMKEAAALENVGTRLPSAARLLQQAAVFVFALSSLITYSPFLLPRTSQ